MGLDLSSAGSPVWSADGKHLLAYVAPTRGYAWDAADWWLLALERTPSTRTGNFAALKRQGFSVGFDQIPRLSQWTKDSIVFAAGFGDAVNVWRAPVSQDGRINGSAERLTSGTTLEISPTLRENGELIFASLNRTAAVWSVPADSDQAKLKGDFKKIVEGTAEFMPSISADGRKLAFTDVRSRATSENGKMGFGLVGGATEPLALTQEAADLRVRIRDLSTGLEARISTTSRAPQWHPQISRDGTPVGYTDGKPGQLYAVPADGGSPRMILGGAHRFIWDWSLDKKRVLFGSVDKRVHSLDLRSASDKVFLEKPSFTLYQAKFSLDDQSVALIACRDYDSGVRDCRIFVVPIENGVPAPTDHWIAIDHPSHWDDKPRWSPNGNLLYFISDRDGYLCLWAQKLANRTKAPVGTPFPVYHFHSARLSTANLDMSVLEIGVAKDKIIVGLGELTGNAWSMRRSSK